MPFRFNLFFSLLVSFSLATSALAWNPTPSHPECERMARYTYSFRSAEQFERWLSGYHLTDVASGHVEVYSRLRRCGELGYAAAQDLVQLTPIQLDGLSRQAKAEMPDYHLAMSYAYNRGGEQTPSLALQWRSGGRVHAEERLYAGTEADHDSFGQRVYGAADAVSSTVGFRASGALSFLFGSPQWEDEVYLYRFDLSDASNVRRLAGEPVSLLVRNSHGKLGTRAFSFASFE